MKQNKQQRENRDSSQYPDQHPYTPMKAPKIKLALMLAVFASIGSHALAQLKVGNNPSTIHPSAALEVESTNKGFLPPRVALASTADTTTIPSPAVGLIVVNTANAGSGVNAVSANTLYMWNGSQWGKVALSSFTSFASNTRLVRRSSASQSSGNSGSGRLLTQSSLVDDGSWNNSDSSYTVPETGTYLISMRASLGINSSGVMSAGYSINPSSYTPLAELSVNYGGTWTRTGTGVVYLTAGTKLYPWYSNCTGCSATSYVYSNVLFAVTQLSR
jgi:hypothetical protein